MRRERNHWIAITQKETTATELHQNHDPFQVSDPRLSLRVIITFMTWNQGSDEFGSKVKRGKKKALTMDNCVAQIERKSLAKTMLMEILLNKTCI